MVFGELKEEETKIVTQFVSKCNAARKITKQRKCFIARTNNTSGIAKVHITIQCQQLNWIHVTNHHSCYARFFLVLLTFFLIE